VRIRWLLLAAAFAVSFSQKAQVAKVGEIVSIVPATTIDEQTPPSTVSTQLAAATMAIHFATLKLQQGAKLTLVDSVGNSSEIVGPQESTDLWSAALSGREVTVKCYSAVHGGCSASFDKFARGFAGNSLRLANQRGFEPTQVCGTCGLEEITCEKAADGVSPAIARVTVGGVRSCTGFLVGEDGFFFTNKHCIDGRDDARRATFEFDAREAECSKDCARVVHAVGKTTVVGCQWIDDDGRLDLTVVRLRDSSISKITPLQMRIAGVQRAENVYIVQYPLGESQKIAFDYIRDQDAEACHVGGVVSVGYNVDTRNGSSGSPVVSTADNLVVAVHTCSGCPNRGVSSKLIYDRFHLEVPASSFK
jgi:V8-like Glu-specific endopeptidase